MKPVRSNLLKETPDRYKYMSEQNAKVLAGNVSFGTAINDTDGDRNIRCSKVSGTTPGVANTEFSVAHTLGTIPMGFLVLSTGAAAHIYKSTTAWTTTTIYLKCDQPTVAFALIIL